jgi:hypothetical protein
MNSDHNSKLQKALITLLRSSLLTSLLGVAASTEAVAQKASPKEMQCHAEATKRYIGDFRQIGPRYQDSDETVVTLVNDKSLYEVYYAECLGRWNSMKQR